MNRILVAVLLGTLVAPVAWAQSDGVLPNPAEGLCAVAGEGGGDSSLTRKQRRRIQERLNEGGFAAGKPDGAFGPRTREAIRGWQAARNSEATGYLTERQARALLKGEREGAEQSAHVQLILPDGGRYEGESRNGKPHGRGIETWPSRGVVYEGEWYEGERHGQGVLMYHDGGRYKGEFRCGFPYGQGVHTWPDGTRYEGGYSRWSMRRNGQGVLTAPDGTRYEGKWNNDWLVEGTVTFPDGRRVTCSRNKVCRVR